MKKLCAAVLVLFLLLGCAFAENEINFQGISWLSDEETVIRSLQEAGLVSSEYRMGMLTSENSKYIMEDETGFVWPIMYKFYNDVCLSASLSGYAKGRIAGYPVKDLTLSFAYDGAYKLISVKVELIDGEYSDLKAKLSKVYGNGEENVNEDGITTNLWRGDNHSCVLLHTEDDGNSFELVYGRLDGIGILNECFSVDHEDVQGL